MSTLQVAVGCKVIPDYDALRAADWAGAARAGVKTRYVRRVPGVYDEAALELALRLRDGRAADGLETGLTALSAGGREAEPLLETLLALGYERATRVDPGAGIDFAPGATAALLAGLLRHGGLPDVVLFGSRCGPAESGTVPFRVAAALDLPCLAEVTELEPAGGRRLRVTFASGGGPVRATITPPCVLAVGDAVVSMLRVPTLKDRLAARERAIKVLAPADAGVDMDEELAREPVSLLDLVQVDRSRPGTLVAGATPAEAAHDLWEHHLRARLESL